MTKQSDSDRGDVSFFSKYRNELGLVLAIVGVIGVTLIFNRDYLNPDTFYFNLTDILHETSLLGIFALGAAIVIISGGIDLSSGSVIVFSGSVCALVMLVLSPYDYYTGMHNSADAGVPAVVAAIIAALIVGVLVGTLHAWLITVVNLPPFVATLASLVGLRSLAKILNQQVTAHLNNQRTKVPADSETFAALSQWWVALIVFLVLGLVCWIVMNRTVIGRHLYALGGNEQAARLSGIRTDRLKWLAYSIGGATSAIAGVLFVAKVGAANPSTLAVGYELNAIAAAVVGGCSLQGGVGLIPGVMLGVLFLRVVIDAVAKIVKAGSDDYQGLIVGFLVVLAVAFNELRRQAAASGKQFFPGMLGFVTIPILALLAGVMVYDVCGATTKSLAYGGIAALVVWVLLMAYKFFESRRVAR